MRGERVGRRSFVGVAASMLALGFGSRATAEAQRRRTPRLRFGMRVHVASAPEAPARFVVPRSWIDAQIAWANRLLGPAGIAFDVVARQALPDAHAHLETRADRHALGALCDPRVVDVFVVRSLRDVDDPSQMRRGVHWRPAGRPGAHFVVVSAIAREYVLAHELGHYFGLPHSDTPGNLMSYAWLETPPVLDEDQVRRIVRSARTIAASMADATEPDRR